MLFNKRTISIADRERLLDALDRARESWLTYAPYLDLFRAEVRGTQGVPSYEMPDDVITMNSRFTILQSPLRRALNYALVYPEDEAQHLRFVSVLSPMGTALLGARVDQDIAWPSSSGPEAATVRRLIYQPERDSKEPFQDHDQLQEAVAGPRNERSW
jgi:regulator of nucleoside diphosphate kinase